MTANLESLRARQRPQWFDDAKLGIFLHWGLYSVPAFATATHKSIVDILREDPHGAQAKNPYAEWYYNTLRVPGSATQAYHAEKYGADTPYDSFRDTFEAGLENFDPDKWAATFKAAGAGYVVITTKHHDGYLLWPSDAPNPFKERWQSPRDLVGELAEACRAQGMKFGIYYSGGLDWTFEPGPIVKPADLLRVVPTRPDYVAYQDRHFRELIERVSPSILWNDIAWPGTDQQFFDLAADYYEAVPDGLVNDRWTAPNFLNSLTKFAPTRALVNAIATRAVRNLESMVPPKPPHFDFRTPEYSTLTDAGGDKWEATRGIGHSFGYNAQEGKGFLIDGTELVHSFIDIVAHGGNLLLNLGPRGDSTLCPDQVERLMVLGDWLAINGAAIHGAKMDARPAAKTTQGHDVRFTKSGDGKTLYAIIMNAKAGDAVTLDNVPSLNPANITLLGHGTIEARQDNGALAMLIPNGAQTSHAATLAMPL